VIQVVKVSIEVSNGATRFEVAVRAASVGRAVDLVVGRHPKEDVRVKLPIEPEGFFVEDSAAGAGIVETAQSAGIAA
jgi:hypothetical protein